MSNIKKGDIVRVKGETEYREYIVLAIKGKKAVIKPRRGFIGLKVDLDLLIKDKPFNHPLFPYFPKERD